MRRWWRSSTSHLESGTLFETSVRCSTQRPILLRSRSRERPRLAAGKRAKRSTAALVPEVLSETILAVQRMRMHTGPRTGRIVVRMDAGPNAHDRARSDTTQ